MEKTITVNQGGRLRDTPFLREIVIGVISGMIVLAFGQAVAGLSLSRRIYEANVLNYLAACKIRTDLAAFQGMSVMVYDTTVYKTALEYLSQQAANQRFSLLAAIQAMDVVNALTTAGIALPNSDAQMRFKQEQTANDVIRLLSRYDSRFPVICPPGQAPSPSRSETP
jgi:hypothetical protein